MLSDSLPYLLYFLFCIINSSFSFNSYSVSVIHIPCVDDDFQLILLTKMSNIY